MSLRSNPLQIRTKKPKKSKGNGLNKFRVSNTACLALLGSLPVEGILHKNLLSMLVNMIRNKDSIEYKIAQRQLMMRESAKESIFIHIQLILAQYGLPSIFELLNNPQPKRPGNVHLTTKYMR